MCEPLTIGSAILAGGSMLANKIGADQQSAARQQRIDEENQRQFKMQDQSTNLFNNTLTKVAPNASGDAAKTEAANQTASDSALIDRSGGASTPPPAVGGSAPAEVGNSIARATSDALAQGKQQAKLNAATGGVRRTMARNDIALGQAGDQQSILGGNMQRSAAVLPAELADANRAGSGARGIGQILQLASTATGMAGLAGGGPSWGDLFRSGGGAPVMASPAASVAPAGTTQAPGIFTRWFS